MSRQYNIQAVAASLLPFSWVFSENQKQRVRQKDLRHVYWAREGVWIQLKLQTN